MDGARTGRIPARALTVVLALVAALGVGALTVGAGAQGKPPEELKPIVRSLWVSLIWEVFTRRDVLS
jgi:hypothetical protein